ncbi:MFS transporter [Comamonas suwonensis]|uniref:MFS transporter n=1 Tax=Comamonas suwonensis TaxID=2606214 RepID=UPI00145F1430|nr:MFS transporter [Comamonas suwonensis]MBI1624811.1 MFS transporter [Comamonas suwonensis]
MTETPSSNRSRLYVLALLTALSAMTFMDRQILAVLLQPIKQEFGFSDLQIGLITGLGFALTFGLLGIPLGRLADRHERRGLIAWCRGIGGCIAALGALATGAGGLAASRAGAALGDAGGGAASMSILADLYAPTERSRAMSVFGVGAALGALLALLLGPLFAQWWGWRVTLVIIGLGVVLLSLVLRFTVQEPVRALTQAAMSHEDPAVKPAQSAVKLIWNEPVTRFMIVGAACALIAGLSIGSWNVALLARRFDLNLKQAGGISAVAACLSVAGSLFSGWLTDRLARGDVRWQIRIPVIGVGMAGLFGLAYLLVSDELFVLSLACMLIYSFFTAWWAPATYAALSLVVPVQRRATASAMVLMSGALLGNGLGPIAAGWLSDVLNTVWQGQGLRYALVVMMCTLLPGLWAFTRALAYYPGAYRQAHSPVAVVA